jgi:hypothetical protein
MGLNMEPVVTGRSLWRQRLSSEITHWEEWLSARRGVSLADCDARIDPQWPLQTRYRELLSRHVDVEQARFSILDIGAGPLTAVGKTWGDIQLSITAIDPLADAYDRLLATHQLTPPVRTGWCHGELLEERFAEGSFDLVVATDILDQSYDPIRVIKNAIHVAKVGCHIVFEHETNLAAQHRYAGRHQWNLCSLDGDFVIWSPKSRTSVNQLVENCAEVSCTTDSATGRVLVSMLKFSELFESSSPRRLISLEARTGTDR